MNNHLTQNVPKIPVIQARFLPKPAGRSVTSLSILLFGLMEGSTGSGCSKLYFPQFIVKIVLFHWAGALGLTILRDFDGKNSIENTSRQICP
jgi:hypothetical protein